MGGADGAGHWQVRDIIGHLVDTTEGYFDGIDIARSGGTAPDPLGVRGMDRHVDEGAQAFRGTPQADLLARLEKDRAEMLAFIEGLDAEQWGTFLVPHKYMGPLPAFFYPVAQLVDYAVHTWDIRQGAGGSHALDGDAADLLVPFCFIVWQSTADCADVEPFQLGVRAERQQRRRHPGLGEPDGVALEPGDLSDLPLVLEFDAASFVLTAMGRINGGTARGDAPWPSATATCSSASRSGRSSQALGKTRAISTRSSPGCPQADSYGAVRGCH